MTKITYIIDGKQENIYWAASEDFTELKGKTFNLSEMTAQQIYLMSDFSSVTKLLLSAIAGAVIQHAMDQGIEAGIVFAGVFMVEERML